MSEEYDDGLFTLPEPWEPSFEQRFLLFHEQNPKVYEELRRLALEAARRGHKSIGVRMLWEVMRWNLSIMTNDPKFKLNDHYHSRYARMLMEQEPELRGLFEIRKLRT